LFRRSIRFPDPGLGRPAIKGFFSLVEREQWNRTSVTALRGENMKRTSGLCLTAGLTLAVVFLFQLSTSASDKASSSVTFTKDVASILHKNCASCHRAGEIAPMSLISFKDVRPWAKSIREVVVERRMPPWLADPRHGEFANDSRLSQKEIDTIVAWVDGGAREGDVKDLPRTEIQPRLEAWHPDAVFR
jgi:mono/diheme cytochrome c family protein